MCLADPFHVLYNSADCAQVEIPEKNAPNKQFQGSKEGVMCVLILVNPNSSEYYTFSARDVPNFNLYYFQKTYTVAVLVYYYKHM